VALISKDRYIVLEAEGGAIGVAGAVGPQTMTSKRPLQPDIDIDGSGSQTENMHQARAERHLHDASKAIPICFPASIGRSEGTQDNDPLGHADFYEATDIAQDEQKTEATGCEHVLSEDASSSPCIAARQAENSTMGYFSAANMIDQEPHDETHEQPHEKHEATTAASVPTIADQSEKGVTTVFSGIGEDTSGSLPQPYHQPPTHSFATSVAQPTSPRGKQVELAPEVSASDNPSEAEAQPAPRTPSRTRASKAAPGPSATRRTRTAKDILQTADTRSPPATRSTRSAKKKATEAAATQAGSPPPRKGPRRIILHFKRKSKGKTDANVAPESETVGETKPESTKTSYEPRVRGGGFYDGGGDELGVGAEEGDDADEEVVLL
jgi:hypothetical protein